MDTDQILSTATMVGLFTCCLCGVVFACYKTANSRPHMKVSRSDPDFTTILENAVPSASAGRIQPSEDPSA